MSDADTIDQSTDTADPLGRRRCPKCLYDRYGIDAASPCPECGYVVPAGVTVLTLPRATMTRPALVFIAAGAVAFFWFTMRVPLAQRWMFYLSAIPLIVSIALRRLRIAWSENAFVAQIWLSSKGAGFETDVDRDSPLRPIERLATRTLGFAPMEIVLSGANGSWIALIPFAVIAGVFVGVAGMMLLSLRRMRLLRLDDVAPPMYRWSRVRSLDVIVNARSGPYLKMTLAGFFTMPMFVLFGGDEGTAARVREQIDAARP